MHTLIYAPASAPAVYPYGLAQLRADNPNVSFSVNPTAEDLAPFDVFPVTPTDPPACDPRTERIEEAEPALIDGTWQQQWRIRPATPEEEAAYDAMNRPAPDWAGFAVGLIFDSLIQQWFNSLPQAVTNGLSAGLQKASDGKPDLFLRLWGHLAAGIPAEVLAAVVALAEACNLPAGFVEAINPPAGMARARDAAGRFIPDDPATPEDEAWVPAE